MVKHFFVALIFVSAIACQDSKTPKPTEAKTETVIDSVQVLEGEFIYIDSSAVLKGTSFVYGVKIDSLAGVLAQQTDSLKRNQFDMIPVRLKGVINANENKTGWEKIVTIKKILQVSPPKSHSATRIIKGDKAEATQD